MCGTKGHNCRACPFPGAALGRSLSKHNSGARPAKGRKLHGTGDAAKRSKTKSTVQKTRKNHLKKKQYKKLARQPYSAPVTVLRGSLVKDPLRKCQELATLTISWGLFLDLVVWGLAP